MNRILSFGMAAVVTILLSQPVYAKKSGGRGGGGGGKAHFSASAMHAKVAKTMRAPSMPKMPKMAKQARPHFNGGAAVARLNPTKGRAAIAQVRPKGPSIARGGSLAQSQGKTPGIAFGGTARQVAPSFQPPTDVTRDWDRGRVQTWNEHHYRWSDGAWVILDGGFYGSPYGTYSGDQPVFNYYSEPGYANTLNSTSMIAGAQNELAQLGYNPGPADGVIGPQTQDAIASFQGDRHLPVTGQLDTPTLQALGL